MMPTGYAEPWTGPWKVPDIKNEQIGKFYEFSFSYSRGARYSEILQDPGERIRSELASLVGIEERQRAIAR